MRQNRKAGKTQDKNERSSRDGNLVKAFSSSREKFPFHKYHSCLQPSFLDTNPSRFLSRFLFRNLMRIPIWGKKTPAGPLAELLWLLALPYRLWFHPRLLFEATLHITYIQSREGRKEEGGSGEGVGVCEMYFERHQNSVYVNAKTNSNSLLTFSWTNLYPRLGMFTLSTLLRHTHIHTEGVPH